MNIEELIKQSNENGNEVWIAGPASLESISILQEKMNVMLPKSYRSFLQNYGAFCLRNEGLSGIIDNTPLKMECGGIYADTIFMREDYSDQYVVPSYLWVIERHEDGAYCFNTNINTTSDEFGIVNYEPYLPEDSYNDVLAPTFNDFLTEWYFQLT